MTTEARRAYLAEWRKKNRDKVNASKRKYMASHPEAREKQKEIHKKWTDANRDHVNEYHRKYYRKKCEAQYKKEDEK